MRCGREKRASSLMFIITFSFGYPLKMHSYTNIFIAYLSLIEYLVKPMHVFNSFIDLIAIYLEALFIPKTFSEP